MITTLIDYINEYGKFHTGPNMATLTKNELSLPDAVETLRARCPTFDPSSSPLFFRGRVLEKDYYCFIQDPKERLRLSTMGNNHYGLLMDKLPSWQSFPSRQYSIIYSNFMWFAATYGNTFMVFPLDNATVGLAPTQDIIRSFEYIDSRRNPAKMKGSDFFNYFKHWGLPYDNWEGFCVGMDDVWASLGDLSSKYQSNKLSNRLIAEKEKGGSWLAYLDKILNPTTNYFKHATYDGVFLQDQDERKRYVGKSNLSLKALAEENYREPGDCGMEMWTDKPCLLVHVSKAKELLSAFEA